MKNIILKFKKTFPGSRIVLYTTTLVAIVTTTGFGLWQLDVQKNNYVAAEQRTAAVMAQQKTAKQYSDTLKLFSEAKKLYPDIDLSAEEALMPELWGLIKENKLEAAKDKYYQIINSFNAKIADEEAKKDFTGSIAYQNKPVGSANIEIKKDDQILKTIQSAQDGSYHTKLGVGKYQIKVTLSGYLDFNGEIEVTDAGPATLAVALTKPVIAAVPKPTASATPANTSDGLYSLQTINTDRGAFTVKLLTIDLNQYRMVVDTAADGDCVTNCPVLSLQEYVSRNGGVAGIHGTYFCPTSYPDCAAKTNSFYFKMFNGRIGKKINWSNGLGDFLPFLRISSSGTLSYHSTWAAASDLEMSTGISCRPHLVENGNIVLTAGDLDSTKESTDKISHGFIGHRGQVVYAGVVLSATLFDSAAVSKALGLEDSFNLDGGGTTALYSNGSYKAGPGRAMPNAIVFKKK